MKAMIFAAGRGERMRPLTDNCPKPLLEVHGQPLIVWHIQNLVKAGITEIVINHAYLGEMIEEKLGDGNQYGASIQYSAEVKALETAGGVALAKHLLGDDPFIALAADIWCPGFDFHGAASIARHMEGIDAWLYLVENPEHNPNGDFALNELVVANDGPHRCTFSAIGVYRPQMFDAIVPGETAKLAPLLRQRADQGKVCALVYHGEWADIGTPERLAQINNAG